RKLVRGRDERDQIQRSDAPLQNLTGQLVVSSGEPLHHGADVRPAPPPGQRVDTIVGATNCQPGRERRMPRRTFQEPSGLPCRAGDTEKETLMTFSDDEIATPATTTAQTDTFIPADDDDMKTIAALVKSAKIALLTTITTDGHLHSRPLATQEVDFDGDLWFFTQDPSSKVDDIHANPQVNAAFESGKGYLSVAGTASIVHDRAKVDELWTPSVEAWFPDGKDDPTVALIKIT